MKLKTLALLTAFSLCAAEAAVAESSVPAWQEPGFVMEEVVVTLPAAAAHNAAQVRSEMLLRALMHRRLTQLSRSAGELGSHVDTLAVSP